MLKQQLLDYVKYSIVIRFNYSHQFLPGYSPGNEQVDILAKQALEISHVDLQVPLSKAEVKSFFRIYAQNTW